MHCSQSTAQQHGGTKTTTGLHKPSYSKNYRGERTGVTEYLAILLYKK